MTTPGQLYLAAQHLPAQVDAADAFPRPVAIRSVGKSTIVAAVLA
ncbi:hypothetical protein ACTMS0_13700 [Micromonospora sp. H33]